jgi:hypothetical protein
VVERNFALPIAERLRIGSVRHVDLDAKQLDQFLHVDQRSFGSVVDLSESRQRQKKLEHVGVHENEVADSHRAGEHSHRCHDHQDPQPEAADHRLSDA